MSSGAVLLMFESIAVLFVALGVPLKRRKVRPNVFYGFRSPATLRNERLWYDVNERSGEDKIGVGIVLGALAGLLFVLELRATTIALVCSAWTLAGVLFSLAHCLLFIHEQDRA